MDHAPDPHAPHSHGHAHDHPHDHAHGHDHHHHGDAGDYYLQQLLTIFICGAFGVAGLLMCILPAGPGVVDDVTKLPVTKIGVLLAPEFHIWVLIGSGVLLAVTAVRGIALWRSAGADGHAHHHDHGHGHDHADGHHHHHDHKPGEVCNHPSHDHHHDHPHDADHGDHSAEDHAHGNVYWRVVVLLLPIVILVMGLPNGTFSTEYLLARVKGNAVGELGDVADRGKTEVGFETLASAAYSPQSREAFTGQTATVSGQLKRINEKQFTLFFFTMTCCRADQVPLKATCVVKERAELDNIPDGAKVMVTGRIQFAEAGTDNWVTVLRVEPGGLKVTK